MSKKSKPGNSNKDLKRRRLIAEALEIKKSDVHRIDTNASSSDAIRNFPLPIYGVTDIDFDMSFIHMVTQGNDSRSSMTLPGYKAWHCSRDFDNGGPEESIVRVWSAAPRYDDVPMKPAPDQSPIKSDVAEGETLLSGAPVSDIARDIVQPIPMFSDMPELNSHGDFRFMMESHRINPGSPIAAEDARKLNNRWRAKMFYFYYRSSVMSLPEIPEGAVHMTMVTSLFLRFHVEHLSDLHRETWHASPEYREEWKLTNS